MKAWEYHQVEIDKLPQTMIEVFDSLGKQGWELVVIYENTAYFKRSINLEPRIKPVRNIPVHIVGDNR